MYNYVKFEILFAIQKSNGPGTKWGPFDSAVALISYWQFDKLAGPEPDAVDQNKPKIQNWWQKKHISGYSKQIFFFTEWKGNK